MAIKILPDEVASQIAAGEVVERPASVVKELIENSLDSGATFIQVRIEQAGKRLIEVTDDGSGIPPDEIRLAVSRHATSKLDSAADLVRIVTLGFRGEALASIGSVSRMAITSMVRGGREGARLQVEGGVIRDIETASATEGTQVRVEDLFYNVPARLKFLKTEATEKRNIDAVVARYAAAYPQVRFILEQDGHTSIQTTGNGDQREALGALYDSILVQQMLEVSSAYPESGISVRGFVSPTTETKGNRSGISLFVNRRWVQDHALASAVVQAYHTMIMVGRFPFGIIFVDLPAHKVDVNVHPAKAEVRFQDSGELFSAVQRAIRRGLLSYSSIPTVHSLSSEPGASEDPWEGNRPDQDAGNMVSSPYANQQAAGSRESAKASDKSDDGRSKVPLLRLIGQISNSYIVAEGPDGLYLVDQHAAHERVLFERFMLADSKRDASQQLLSPVVVEFGPEDFRLVMDQLPQLVQFGFEVEEFGPGAFIVRAIPVLLQGSDPARALRVLVEEFEEDETPLETQREARIIARVCKRAAVKAGQSLSGEEQRALLKDLEACRSPRTCPHGRPTMIHISLDVLERQFGRKGAL